MTTFRAPVGWNTVREPGRRPPLEYVEQVNKNSKPATRAYWLKIHWATPPWLTDEQFNEIKAIYRSANPQFEHVDHIVPLSNPLVCGLHVPWNLQVIPIKDNYAKSNIHWPHCPDHLCPIKNGTDDMFGEPDPHQLGIGI